MPTCLPYASYCTVVGEHYVLMLWFCMVLCRGSTPLRHLHVCDLRHAAHASGSSPESRTHAHLSTASFKISISREVNIAMHQYNIYTTKQVRRRVHDEMYEYDSTRSKNFPRDCTSVKYIWCRCRTRYTALWCRSGCRVPSRQHREHAHVCSVTGVTQDSGRTPATPACIFPSAPR